MLRYFKNNQGFSIVQVMVAIGLSGVLSLVVMKISSNMNTVQNEAESSMEETELKLEFRMILDNSDHCTVSLAGLDPVNAPVKFKKSLIDDADTEGMDVELFQKNSTGRTKRFTGNQSDNTPTLIKLKKLKIKSMKLVMPNPPANANYPQATKHTDIGRLVVIVEKLKRTKRYQLPLVVTMSTAANGDSTILQCRSQPNVDPCPPLGMVLDQNTGTCRPPKVIAAGYARSSNYGGIWGNWGSWDNCTADRMVCGIQTKVEDGQGGGDDTALNSVRLICCHSLPIGRLNMQDIYSKQGGWGGWGNEEYCPPNSYARGIRMKLEPNQGGGGGNDDTATNAVQLRCSDPGNTQIASKQGGWGNWDGYGNCPANQHICGLRTRVEDDQGGGDDTAFNGIETRCCAPNE